MVRPARKSHTPRRRRNEQLASRTKRPTALDVGELWCGDDPSSRWDTCDHSYNDGRPWQDCPHLARDAEAAAPLAVSPFFERAASHERPPSGRLALAVARQPMHAHTVAGRSWKGALKDCSHRLSRTRFAISHAQAPPCSAKRKSSGVAVRAQTKETRRPGVRLRRFPANSLAKRPCARPNGVRHQRRRRRRRAAALARSRIPMPFAHANENGDWKRQEALRLQYRDASSFL